MFARAQTVGTQAVGTQTVGTVTDVRLLAFGTPPNGVQTRKSRQDGVVLYEFLETYAGGSMIVRLIDDTEVTLGSNSQITIDEFVFNPRRNTVNAVLRLATGALYFASGRAGQQDIAIQTPVAHIGFRGTQFWLLLLASGALEIGICDGRLLIGPIAGTGGGLPAGNTATVSPDGQSATAQAGLQATGDPAIDAKIAECTGGQVVLPPGPGGGNWNDSGAQNNPPVVEEEEPEEEESEEEEEQEG
jgi:hypothetical protein